MYFHKKYDNSLTNITYFHDVMFLWLDVFYLWSLAWLSDYRAEIHDLITELTTMVMFEYRMHEN